MARKTLTKEDVSKLLANPSGATRAEMATKIGTDFGDGVLTDGERKLAEEIFRVMAKDAEVRVREALSQTLKDSPSVPRDVALSLAKDINSVALPVLQFSEVLSDEDLIEIVRGQDPQKQVAIATRPAVSEALSDVLVESKNEEAVTALVSNEGADISEGALQKVVTEYGDKASMQAALVRRPKLPVTVSERLLTMVSDNLRSELAKRHELSEDMTADLIMQTRERAIVTLSADSDGHELERLIKQLRKHGRLTSSLVLRALCMGDINFFEAAMAEMVGVPVINARQLIHDTGSHGLKAAYEKAGLPRAQFPAVRAAIDVAKEMEYDGGKNDRERYSRRMIERILTQYGDMGVDFESDDLEYLLDKMNQLPAESVRQV